MASIQTASISRGSFELAGNLHLPEGFDTGRKHPAVIIATPGSSVKEQIGANYARALAQKGFVALAFDPAYQGQSGGEPRDLEDPAERVADLRYAVDFLTALDHVDAERIGVLGICAGGGYAVNAAMTDHRIKAVGTVVPVNIGRAFRAAVTASGSVAGLLKDVARQATAEARGGQPVRHPWIPDTVRDAESAGVTDIDVLQAVTYYRTPRGRHERSTNRRHYRSDALILGFDAFHLADELLTQPVQVIVAGEGGSTGSLEDGRQLTHLAREAEDILVIEGARHYEMYDEPEYIAQAVECLGKFFDKHLG
ncbi:alpha/beta hydrolase [Microbispora sp. KK1-11]|uniref:alpha/beta hydrolase n=1 Tax=Microbispora sp. KK1-11 TaxID=2053005 RepID=UPI00115AACE0|nr:alpha/beta hydrolase [Microbispora sp. KK1-11]TQS29473.1 alpha/beta hydrolase [Microbispora sp. KK1-11]